LGVFIYFFSWLSNVGKCTFFKAKKGLKQLIFKGFTGNFLVENPGGDDDKNHLVEFAKVIG
jgi:hypothetical protein